MASNEHPDMSGNPCDDPIICDQCGEPCDESDLYGSRFDEEKYFCGSQCADEWEDGWEPLDGSVSLSAAVQAERNEEKT